MFLSINVILLSLLLSVILSRFFKQRNCLSYFQQRSHEKTDSFLILTYHSVVEKLPTDCDEITARYVITSDQFEKEIDFLLGKGYHFISLSNAIELATKSQKTFEKMAVLTFDGCDQNWLKVVAPILVKRSMCATFYVTSDWLNKTASNHGTSVEGLTLEELGTLARLQGTDGQYLAEIGSHTKTHQSLIKSPQESDTDYITRLNEELADSRAVLEAASGHSVEHFSLPFGHFGNADSKKKITCVAQQAGYLSIRTTDVRFQNRIGRDFFNLANDYEALHDPSMKRLIFAERKWHSGLTSNFIIWMSSQLSVFQSTAARAGYLKMFAYYLVRKVLQMKPRQSNGL